MSLSKQPILESISSDFGNSLAIHCYEEASNDFAPKWHFHPEIELVYINGGAGKRHIGNHISNYVNGDLVLIGSNLPHFGFTNPLTGNKSEVVIQFNEDFLGKDFFETPEMISIKQLFKRSKQGLVFHSETKKFVGVQMEKLVDLTPFDRIIQFLGILKELAQSENFKLLHVDNVIIESKPQDTNRLDTIYSIVRTEFTRHIPLAEVANAISMSEPSFSRYFKNKTGKTFTQFANEYRLVHACKLLGEEGLSITNICYECGFNNFSHFNKKFKAFTGQSPSQYRNQLKTIYKP